MNKWQTVYCNTYYDGKMPKSTIGKQEFELLGNTKNEVIVHYPDFNGIGGFKPAHTEVYKVTEDTTDMPNGTISACVLAKNLSLWLSRGYKVETR